MAWIWSSDIHFPHACVFIQVYDVWDTWMLRQCLDAWTELLIKSPGASLALIRGSVMCGDASHAPPLFLCSHMHKELRYEIPLDLEKLAYILNNNVGKKWDDVWREKVVTAVRCIMPISLQHSHHDLVLFLTDQQGFMWFLPLRWTDLSSPFIWKCFIAEFMGLDWVPVICGSHIAAPCLIAYHHLSPTY